jgi:hypothetical protein
MNTFRYLHFTRLPDANELDMIAKKKEGAFNSRVAKRTLTDIRRIIEAEGYKINKRRIFPKALSGAFLIFLERITVNAWLFAITEDKAVDLCIRAWSS